MTEDKIEFPKLTQISLFEEEELEYEFHDLADIFPLMQGNEFEELKEDIKENGLLEGIVIYKGKILDGRNRYRACEELGIDLKFKELPNSIDPLDYVIAQNLHRRHLTTATKAEIALKVLKIEKKEAKKRQEATQLISRGIQKQEEMVPPSEGGTINPNNPQPTITDSFPKRETSADRAEKALEVLKKEEEKNKNSKPRPITPKPKPEKKGEAVRITAKRFQISHNTLRTANKVKELNDPKINQKWEEAKKGTETITNVRKAIKKKKQKEITERKKQENLKKERETKPTHQKREYIPRIHKKDAVKFLDSIKDKSQDLLLTDPPYMKDLDIDIKDFTNRWVLQALRKVKDTGKIYIFTGNYPQEIKTYIEIFNSQDRFILSNILIWTYKNTIGPSTKRKYKNNYQCIFYLYGKDAPPLNTESLLEKLSVKEFNAPDGRQYNRYFKWQKPDDLTDLLIEHGTIEGNKVLDLFAGTGTFVLRATRKKRYAKGCEIDPEILKIAKKRGCIIK